MLKEGDKAPPFRGINQDNKEISLEDFKGKKLALVFYPKDNTPTCTVEVCNLSDNFGELKRAGYEIVGVSVDSVKSHQNFIKKYSLPFSLISDEEKKIVEDYKVWVEKSMYGKTFMGTARITFIIDENGIINKIIDKVKAKEHSSQILSL